MHLLVPEEQVQQVKKHITEGTSGRANMEKEKDVYFADVNGETKIWEC